jgi:protein-tyrosine phosphatase
MPANKILFLCTGNYYRSRFAEELFNHLAQQKGSNWSADSRGLVKNPWLLGNFGPISSFAVKELEKRSVKIAQMRFPKHLEHGEADKFNKVIALDKDEHEPLLEKNYPEITARVIYWNIKDLGDEKSESALGRLETKIEALISRLTLDNV